MNYKKQLWEKISTRTTKLSAEEIKLRMIQRLIDEFNMACSLFSETMFQITGEPQPTAQDGDPNKNVFHLEGHKIEISLDEKTGTIHLAHNQNMTETFEVDLVSQRIVPRVDEDFDGDVSDYVAKMLVSIL